MQPHVIFIHGPVASGKLTVAKELCRITGFRLFHNHLTVDLLLAVFPFGSPAFVRLREELWIKVMTEGVREGASLVFTFAPERTVSHDFIGALTARINEARGRISFVQVQCSEEAIEARVEASSRKEYQKLNSLAEYRLLRQRGAFAYPVIASECMVDLTSLSPVDAAIQICTSLSLPNDKQLPNHA